MQQNNPQSDSPASDYVLRLSREVDVVKIQDLTQAVGWGRRGDDKWREILSKSAVVCSLWHGERLVGFGRIVEDGVMSMMYDIAVHPDLQRQGLGSKIMQALIDQVKDKGYVSIGLFAWDKNPGNIPFYEKFEFVASHGMELARYMKTEGGSEG
jgi:GNAT superfamily N-acetyltransferase